MESKLTTTATTYSAGRKLVKEHFTIREFNIKYDLHCFITQAGKVRKLQKQYYSTQDKQKKQYLLIQCKQAELTLDKLGNALWIKYKLAELPLSPLYRLG